MAKNAGLELTGSGLDIDNPAQAANVSGALTVGGAITAAAVTLSGLLTAAAVTLSGLLTTAGSWVSTSATRPFGYGVGAGGAVAQATNRSTGVTLSKPCGTITTQATSLAGLAEASFTVTNTLVRITDVIALSVQSGPTALTSKYFVTAVAAGSFVITAYNSNATTADTGAAIINFAIVRSEVT